MASRVYLELFIALRYLRGRGRTAIFQTGTRLSLVFLSLMVFVMVVVLSVFEGFQREVRQSLWNSGYHVAIRKASAGGTLQNYDPLISSLQKLPGVRSSYPGVTVSGLLEWGGHFEGKLVRALPVHAEDVARGRLRDFPEIVHYKEELLRQLVEGDSILVGREVASYYRWQLGDKVRLLLPRGGILSRNMQVTQHTFVIAGFFRTGYYEFDQNLFLLSLSTARRVLGINGAGEIVVQLRDVGRLDRIAADIRSLLGHPDGYAIETIRDTKGNFLAALQLERTFMVLIMGLLILAGAAGIWVTVHLLIRAKETSIGMLRAMGLPLFSTVLVFTVNSMVIGLLAAIIGGGLGIFYAQHLESIIYLVEDGMNGLCHLISGNCTLVELIPRNIYYFDRLPVSIDPGLIFGVGLLTCILSGLAGYFPARRAALRDPIRAIRG